MTRMSKPPAKPLPARAGISELGPGCVRAGEGSDPVGPSRMWIGKGGDGMGWGGTLFKNITRMRGSFVYQSGDMILHRMELEPIPYM